MDITNKVLAVLHFIGLTMGFSVSIANIVMSGLMSRAESQEQAVLGRFPPLMSRVGSVGLALLWITGISLVFTKWQGFTNLPPMFWYKVGSVVGLTITVGVIHGLERQVRSQGPSALGKVQSAGKVATLFGVLSLVLAVLAFR